MLRAADQRGQQTTMHDPYAFPPLLTEYDLHLLAEGRHWKSYQRLGAQLRTIDGVAGVNFAVWAPNAAGVSIVGDFNNWDARFHAMRKHIPSGVWELFIPGLTEGTIYKFRVKQGATAVDKSDPYGFAAEVPPRTASKVVESRQLQVERCRLDGQPRENPTGSTRRSPSMKSIWEAGGGRPTIRTAG